MYCERYDLVERSGEQPAGGHDGAQYGAVEVEQMDRFVVVGDVEASRVVAQPAQRAVAASIGRTKPLVNRRTQVYLSTDSTTTDQATPRRKYRTNGNEAVAIYSCTLPPALRMCTAAPTLFNVISRLTISCRPYNPLNAFLLRLRFGFC